MKTKTSRSSSAVLRLCGVALFASFHSLSAQTSSNLIEDATVRSTGTYTYYARGDANAASITPFTTMFYPGGLNHSGNATLYRDNGLDDSVDTPAPVGIGSGFLTNLGAAQSVGGWVNVEDLVSGSAGSSHAGSVDIVFDLGSLFTITSVVITYTDSSGYRWNTVADAQSVFTSVTAPTSDAGLELFGNGTAVGSVADVEMTISGTAIDARYVVFRPVMTIGANPNSGIASGLIDEVAVYGYAAIPEPSSAALMLGGAGLVICLARRRRHNA